MGLAITQRELWNLIHLSMGALFLHSFFEGIRGLLSSERARHLTYGAVAMAAVAWITVISGTWFVYPGYRAKPPAGADLLNYPQRYLLADSQLASWHTFGMEWKEHAGWIPPIVATAVAFIVLRYRDRLWIDDRLRKSLLGLFVAAFMLAIVSGTLGAFISKVAPNTFLDLS